MFWLWLSGMLALLARAAVAWWKARDMVTRDFACLTGSVEFAAHRLARQLGAKRVRFRASARVASALVFGWLKPVVVLPAAALGRLTEAEIEALLAHELAHVIRGDFLVNLLQTIAECVLFYHPLVWWVSARMREERELCCDDIAVAVCRDEVLYSRALLRLEELRMEPALAATGGRLAHRIRRLLAGPESDRITVAPGLALVLLLGVSVALLAQIAPPEPPAPPAAVAAALEPPAPPQEPAPTGSVTAYRIGADVSMPRPIYKVEPDYTPEAQAAHLEGTTFLSVVISPEGVARDIKLVRSLDPGLDRKAIEAVRKWKFEPGLKDGKPVPVIASIEINFRLLDKPPVPPVAPVPPSPGVAPVPALAPVARPAALPHPAPMPPEPAIAPEPPEPPSESVDAPAPPTPPAVPANPAIRGVVGGVPGGVKRGAQGGVIGGVPGGVKQGVPGGVVGGVPGGVAEIVLVDRSELERRLRYAADRLGGENTDRGKVYMRYGPPDEIDSQTSQGKRVDIWRYKDTSKAKVMLEIEFQDGVQVKRTGAFAADL
jgi:TonB family protein